MTINYNNKLKKISDYEYEIEKEENMNVSGIIFADEKIISDIDERVITQLSNVAGLPGIQKNAFAMPDTHQGYGFPIGGVGAFSEKENGIISVGGVGYDINCLIKDSKILTEHGYYKSIQDFENDFLELKQQNNNYLLKTVKVIQSIISYDLNEKKIIPQDILLFMKRKHDDKILEITTKLGYRISVTKEHPILTKYGMIDAEKLEQNNYIAIHPFEGICYRNSSAQDLILNTENFTETEARELEKRNLLKLTYNHDKLPIIAKLIGYLIGDGSVYISNKKGHISAFGQIEDLETIKRDIEKLGYSAKIYSRQRYHKINTRYGTSEFIATNNELHCKSTSFARLLQELGYPKGEKTINKVSIPNWIIKSPLWIKRLFLGGFFGAEMSAPRTHTKTGFDCPTISINKNTSLIENGREFAIQIISLLEEFDVKVHKLLETNDYFNKHENTSRLKIQISSEEENLLKLWSKIGFDYNIKKDILSKIAIIYIKEKKYLTAKRKETANKIKNLKKIGISLKEIQKLLPSEIYNDRFIERHYYENIKQRITLNFISFKDFVNEKIKEFREYGCFFDRIENISTKEYSGFVYDFNIPKTHNFVSNSIIVSNCGVRTLITNKTYDEIKPFLTKIADALYKDIPAGLGSKGKLSLNQDEIFEVMTHGSKFLLKKGFANKEDIENTEDFGCIDGGNVHDVSETAIKRESRQIGTLGSGNHYLELQRISDVYDKEVAEKFKLKENNIVLTLHCGSRALGHQTATDYMKLFSQNMNKYNLKLKDRELISAPINSIEGQKYYSAMVCATNYAFANRQTLTHITRESLKKIIPDIELNLLYDVGHNTCKIEKHKIDKKTHELYVHRKGATRAYGAKREELGKNYYGIGQPVIIGGSMGTASYILCGIDNNKAFESVCHGAGRSMSRTSAIKSYSGEELVNILAKKGIIIKGHSLKGLAEEAPSAYKDVNNVIDVIHNAGLSKKVVKMKPLVVVKG